MRSHSPPRLLYLVSEDWYFLSHRLPMARAARDAGYEVHVATRVVTAAPRSKPRASRCTRCRGGAAAPTR